MWKKLDWYFLGVTLLIALIGLVTLLSTNIDVNGTLVYSGSFAKQILNILIGLVLYFIASRINYSYLRHIQVLLPAYIFTILLLSAVLIWAPEINSSKRWLLVAGFQLQPSEIAKILVVLITASIMSLQDKYHEFFLAALSFVLIVPFTVFIYLQPHGTMSILMLVIWFFVVFTAMREQIRNTLLLLTVVTFGLGLFMIALDMYLVSGVLLVIGTFVAIMGSNARDSWWKFFAAAFGIGVLTGGFLVFAWEKNLLLDYQKDRIEAFFNPSETSQDIGFNVDQSRVAIGSGRFLGKGFGLSSQSKLHFLPENRTDFIFAAYAEQFGLVGTIFLLAAYGYMIYRILVLANVIENDTFGTLLALGLGVKVLLEVFINIGTNTGIIPATGIPLPLMSYGGTITVLTFFFLGLVQSIIVHKPNEIRVSSFIDNEDILI